MEIIGAPLDTEEMLAGTAECRLPFVCTSVRVRDLGRSS